MVDFSEIFDYDIDERQAILAEAYEAEVRAEEAQLEMLEALVRTEEVEVVF